MAKACALPRGMEMYREQIKNDAGKYVENGMVKATKRQISELESALEKVLGRIAPEPEVTPPARQDVVKTPPAPEVANKTMDALMDKGNDTFLKKLRAVLNIDPEISKRYNPLYAMFAQAAKEGFNPSVKMSAAPVFKDANGREFPDVAGLFKNGAFTLFRNGLTPKTFVHEAVHGLTVSGLEYAQWVEENVPVTERTDDQSRLVQALRNMESMQMEAARLAKQQGKEFYGLKDVFEFVAEAYTNAEFQNWMAQQKRFSPMGGATPSKARQEQLNLWKMFVDGVKRVLSAFTKTDVSKTLLGDVLDTSVEFISTGQSTSGKTYADAATSPIRDAWRWANTINARKAYGGETKDGAIDATPKHVTPFSRERMGDTLANAWGHTAEFFSDKFGYLAAALDKSYQGRALKTSFTLQDSLRRTIQGWQSKRYDEIQKIVGGDKELAKTVDGTTQMLSATLGSRLNDPKWQQKIMKYMEENLPHESWFIDPNATKGENSDGLFANRFVQMLDNPDAQKAIDGLFDMVTEGMVDWEKGTIKMDYWRQVPETSEEAIERRKGKEGREFDVSNTETFNTFTNLNAAQRAKMKEVVRKYFDLNARASLFKAGSQTHAETKMVYHMVERAIRPFGLDITTTGEMLKEVHGEYSGLLQSGKEGEEKAENLRNAVVTLLAKGEFDNTGENASEEFKQYEAQLKAVMDKLTKGKDKKALEPFAKAMNALFAKEMQIHQERPMTSERLVNQVAGFYITQQRQGTSLLRLVPRDEKGKMVRLDRSEYGRLITSVPSQREGERIADEMNKELAKSPMVVVDATGDVKTITFQAEVTTQFAKDVEGEGALTLRQLFTALETAGVNLSPENREKLVRTHTAAGQNALRMLHRNYHPGQDLNGQQLLMQHLNNMAFAVADNAYGADIDELLAHEWSKVNLELEVDQKRAQIEALEKAGTPAAKALLVLERDRLAKLEFGLKHHNEQQAIATQRHAAGAREAVRQEAMDDGVANVFNKLRQFTAVAALGAAVSSFVTNIMGGGPATIAYLGGIYGNRRAAMAIPNALWDLTSVGGLNFFKQDVGADAVEKYAKGLPAGAEKEIWMMVADEMAQGRLQVGQAMSALRIANEGASEQARLKNQAFELMMRPFTASEAIVRIGTFVAAARLEAQDRGEMPKRGSAEFKLWREGIEQAGADAIENTQGVYDQWAKGAWMRRGLSGTLTMFKHYPIVQLTLIKNMNWEQRAVYAAALWALAGADGFPGAEDAKELFNLLVKAFPGFFGKLGFDARKTTNDIYKKAADVTGIPSDLMKSGLLSYMTGADFTGSMGLGGILPLKGFDGTGALTDSMGPVAGFVNNTWDSGSNLFASAVSAARGDTEIAKEKLFAAGKASPFKLVRNTTAAMDVWDDGRMATRNGLTVVNGLDKFDAAMQFAGWRPIEAARGHETADIMKQVNDMRRDMQQNVNNLFTVASVEKNRALEKEAREYLRRTNQMLTEAEAPFRLRYDAATIRKLGKAGAGDIEDRMAEKMPKDMKDFIDELLNHDAEKPWWET